MKRRCFTPTPVPSFSFTPDPVRLNASGNINFHQAQGSSGWQFSGFNCSSSQFGQPQISGQGQNMAVNDAFTQMGSFCYTVSVSANGNPYTSAPEPKPPT
jgi:hypothetical protein